MKLSDVATVRSGLVLSRKQARGVPGISYPLLNLRCIKADSSVDMKQLDVYEASEHLAREYLSQVGDVIVRLSVPYTAVLIDKETANMVVSSNFLIIRADRRNILPEYLVWLLNTKKIKREIYENTSGNMLGAINAKYFAEFELDMLSVKDQQKIAALNSLARQEIRLLYQLAEEKEKLYTWTIERIHKEMKER